MDNYIKLSQDIEKSFKFKVCNDYNLCLFERNGEKAVQGIITDMKDENNNLYVVIKAKDGEMKIVIPDYGLKPLDTNTKILKPGKYISAFCIEENENCKVISYSCRIPYTRENFCWNFPETKNELGNIIEPAVKVDIYDQSVTKKKIPNKRKEINISDNVSECKKDLENIEKETAKVKQSIIAKLLKFKNKEIKTPRTEKEER